jgi:hypothetical protein
LRRAPARRARMGSGVEMAGSVFILSFVEAHCWL